MCDQSKCDRALDLPYMQQYHQQHFLLLSLAAVVTVLVSSYDLTIGDRQIFLTYSHEEKENSYSFYLVFDETIN